MCCTFPDTNPPSVITVTKTTHDPATVDTTACRHPFPPLLPSQHSTFHLPAQSQSPIQTSHGVIAMIVKNNPTAMLPLAWTCVWAIKVRGVRKKLTPLPLQVTCGRALEKLSRYVCLERGHGQRPNDDRDLYKVFIPAEGENEAPTRIWACKLQEIPEGYFHTHPALYLSISHNC